jgi:hypothetical protein
MQLTSGTVTNQRRATQSAGLSRRDGRTQPRVSTLGIGTIIRNSPESIPNPLRGCNSDKAFRKDCLVRAAELEFKASILNPISWAEVRYL